MSDVFADAFYWIALANPADQWHEATKSFDRENPNSRIITTEEVLTEFLNYFADSGTHRRSIAVEMCDQVLIHPNVTVVPQSHETFLKGLDLYKNRLDKGYSLTDCVSLSICRENGINEILTHDEHFRQEGYRILF